MTEMAVGAVLIGGRSRRMRVDKASVEVAGSTMSSRVITALQSAGLEIITVGGPDRVAGFPNVPDPIGVTGPLAGLAAALQYAEDRPVFVTAVDQPLLRTDTIRSLLSIEAHDAVVPRDGGFPQVTCAVYREGCLPALERLTAANPSASIRTLLDKISVRWVDRREWATWGETGMSWRSIDTPEELDEIQRVLEGN